jgi:hypothetical protein
MDYTLFAFSSNENITKHGYLARKPVELREK